MVNETMEKSSGAKYREDHPEGFAERFSHRLTPYSVELTARENEKPPGKTKLSDQFSNAAASRKTTAYLRW